jgi:hypothetical protein
MPAMRTRHPIFPTEATVQTPNPFPAPRLTSMGRQVATTGRSTDESIRIVAWLDPIADPHGLPPNSSYVELYWLPVIGPSTTWLLRRLSYGLEMQPTGFAIDLVETARSLGLGERMGKNSPFKRALQRLCTFELARSHGPGTLAVRTTVPPLALRHVSRLPYPLQAGHRRWLAEQRLPATEQMRRRARRLAENLVRSGSDRSDIERQLNRWHFHPAVAFRTAGEAVGEVVDQGPRQPGSSSWPAGVSPQ